MTAEDKEILIQLAAVLGQKFEVCGETFIRSVRGVGNELAFLVVEHCEHGPKVRLYALADERFALVVAEALSLFPRLVERVIELEERGEGR